MFWEPAGTDDKVQCLLCKHGCVISPGRLGICGVRENRKGVLYSNVYGKASSANPDPIEKKPLFHFHPGSRVFSFGTVGCNFKCLHCQNHSISQHEISESYLKRIKVSKIVDMARQTGCTGIAWTYNEPAIWYEFTYEGSKASKEDDLYTCYVTNGYIQEEPLRRIAPYLDAANVDVKGFSEEFYRKICGAKLSGVLETCLLAYELGIHLELTYLVIPMHNDSIEQLQAFSNWVVENLDNTVPIHFSRFHPDHKMHDVPSTPMTTLLTAYNTAKGAGLEYVYIGNISRTDYENTYCPGCGELLIERLGFRTITVSLEGRKCRKCGREVPIVD